MGSLTKLDEKEVQDIQRRTAMIRAGYNPETIDECTALYKQAESIAITASIAIKDGLQGKALLEAKKIICGDEWNKEGNLSGDLSKKWKLFLQTVNCSRQNASYLLDFAGYKEDGGKIETASHYREAKKIAGSDWNDIDQAYEEAGGSDLTTAKQIKEKMGERTLYVRPVFEAEVGTCPATGLTPIEIGDKMMGLLPIVSAGEWKKWYRMVSRCVHPDHGGTEEDFAVLNSINEMITAVIENERTKQAKSDWENNFKQWKEDHGYKSDFVIG